MHKSRSIIFSLVVALALSTGDACSEEYDREDALRTSQSAIGNAISDPVFRDIHGQTFQLAQLQGKPLVVSMIYTSCHHVCPTITQSLAHSVDIAREALGDASFNVVTIGFDWAVDSPERMRIYARERGIEASNWFFLAGDATSIEALSRDLGFLFYPSAKGFDHLTQTSVLNGEGVLYRQIYGVNIAPPDLVEPLKQLVFDSPETAGFVDRWVDTLRLFCTVYDPNSGRYKFDYSIFMTIIVGVLSLGAIAVFIAREWRHAR